MSLAAVRPSSSAADLASQLAAECPAPSSTFADRDEPLWARLLAAVLREQYPDVGAEQLAALEAHVAGDEWADAEAAILGAHERAGFLVGLELARRLGGAR